MKKSSFLISLLLLISIGANIFLYIKSTTNEKKAIEYSNLHNSRLANDVALDLAKRMNYTYNKEGYNKCLKSLEQNFKESVSKRYNDGFHISADGEEITYLHHPQFTPKTFGISFTLEDFKDYDTIDFKIRHHESFESEKIEEDLRVEKLKCYTVTYLASKDIFINGTPSYKGCDINSYSDL